MKKLLLLWAFLVSNLLCAQSNSLPQSIPTDGLYGYWPLDGNINDLSGNTNDGSTDGTFTTDAFENEDAAVYLNNQMIILPVNDQLNIDNFTIQFWTKAVSYNIHNKVQIADPSGPWRWAINWADSVSPLYDGQFLYYTPGECDGSYAESGNNIDNLVSIDRDIWHLLTVVVEGQQTSFYRDGNLITVSNESSNLTCFNENMSIYFGGDVPGAIEYYNGWFDNIAIWTRALNNDEVESIYSSTLTSKDNSFAAISTFPNPTNNILNINSLNKLNLKVYNQLGQKILDAFNTNKIDVSSISKGVYYIEISDEVNSSTQKFIKN